MVKVAIILSLLRLVSLEASALNCEWPGVEIALLVAEAPLDDSKP